MGKEKIDKNKFCGCCGEEEKVRKVKLEDKVINMCKNCYDDYKNNRF